MLVLVLQIVTGIFLTMNYKPDAAQLAFASVEYIMRDVPWWLVHPVSCIQPGASAFFIVVYLHMFRGLIYGSRTGSRANCCGCSAACHLPLPHGRSLLWLPASHGAKCPIGVRRSSSTCSPPFPLSVLIWRMLDPWRLQRDRRRDVESLLCFSCDRNSAGVAGPGCCTPDGVARSRVPTTRTALKSKARTLDPKDAQGHPRKTAFRFTRITRCKDIVGVSSCF